MHGRGVRFFLLCVITLVSSASRAAAPAPDLEYVDALWVAQSRGLLKIATQSGKPLFEIFLAENVRAVAMDERGGVVWTYDKGHLRSYEFGGKPLSESAVEASDEPAYLAVDAEDGTVWLAAGKALFHHDASGRELSKTALKENVRGLGIDASSKQIWLGDRQGLKRFNSAGTVVFEQALNEGEELQALEFAPYQRGVWVASQYKVELLGGGGEASVSLPLINIEFLAAEPNGGLWAATKNRIYHVEPSGRIAGEWDLFDQGAIVALASGDSSSIWAANEKAIAGLTSEGEVASRTSVGKERTIRAFSHYADRISPSLAITEPGPHAYLNIPHPSFTLSYVDTGIGVDAKTLAAMRDGIAWPLTCLPEEATAKCKLVSALADGAYKLDFTIKDFAGNRARPAEIDFVVDTIAPAIRLQFPHNGAKVKTNEVTIAAEISEPAEVTLNGEGVALDIGNAFSRTIDLADGLNTFVVEAKDRAGNTAKTQFTVSLDTSGQVQLEPADTAKERAAALNGSLKNLLKLAAKTARAIPATVAVTAESIQTQTSTALVPTQTPLQRAVEWLESQQDVSDGSWHDTSETSTFLQTAEAVLALHQANRRRVAYYAGQTWIENHDPRNLDARARRLLVLRATQSNAGQDVSALLAAVDNPAPGQSGWGLAKRYRTSALDTALVLDALRTAGATFNSSQAIAYLKAAQLAGTGNQGWPSAADSTSDAYTTARVVMALAPYQASDGTLAIPLANALTTLRAMVTTVSPPHVRAAAALAYLRMDPGSADARALIDSLTAQQRVDGGFDAGVFTTGLIVQALAAVEGLDATTVRARVSIPDLALHQAINAALGRGAMDQLNQGELAQLTSLDISNSNVADLTGLEYAVDLTSLNAANTLITSTAPLAGLQNLVDVNLNGTAVPRTATSVSIVADRKVSDNTSVTNLTATVTGASPKGIVTLLDGTQEIGSATLGAADPNVGAATSTFQIPVVLNGGFRRLKAIYKGDAANAGSSSMVLVQMVNPDGAAILMGILEPVRWPRAAP